LYIPRQMNMSIDLALVSFNVSSSSVSRDCRRMAACIG
jgi:hypothetical protein